MGTLMQGEYRGEIKYHLKLKHDRHIKPKGIYPSLFIYGPKPRVSVATSRHKKTMHDGDLQIERYVPRTGLYDRIQNSCIENIWPRSHTGRPYSANCSIHGVESRNVADTPCLVQRSVHVRANERGGDPNARLSVRGYFCVTEEELSPVLLGGQMAKYFALSPGGMGFYGHVGALKMLHDNRKLKAMEEISGGSAGAVAAYLHVMCKNDFELLMNEAMETDISEITNLNLRNFFTKYGFINTDGFKSKFIEATRRITGLENPTFKELYEYNPIKLHVSSFCLDTSKTCYFSVDTHPDQPVIDTICGSISVPMIFSPTIIDGKHYIDGGMEEIIPALPFLSKNPKEICCLRIKFIPDENQTSEINNIKDYIGKIMQPLISNRVLYDLPMLNIKMKTSDAFDFTMSEKNKLELFVSGYQSWL